MKNQYWLVGAKFGGTEDQLPKFIERGYWYCWDANNHASNGSEVGNSVSKQQERFKKIRKGDRIAVKKLLGQGSKNIEIRAIGVVKDVDLDEWRAYIDWFLTDIQNRVVPLKGCTASIHGPFDESDEWVQKIFCL